MNERLSQCEQSRMRCLSIASPPPTQQGGKGGVPIMSPFRSNHESRTFSETFHESHFQHTPLQRNCP